MSPSNFHKTHALLRVTNTCHCLVSDDDLITPTYTTYRISLSLLLSYQTYPKAARLASLLPQSPLHMPPASAAPLPRKLPTMCLVPRRPPEKETLVWRLLVFVPLVRYNVVLVKNEDGIEQNIDSAAGLMTLESVKCIQSNRIGQDDEVAPPVSHLDLQRPGAASEVLFNSG